MKKDDFGKLIIRYTTTLLTLTALLLTPLSTNNTSAQQPDGRWNRVRTIYTAEFDLTSPMGLTYLPNVNLFLLWGVNGEVTGITMRKEPVKILGTNIPVAGVQNVAFDQRTNYLFAFNETTSKLEKIGLVETGLSISTTGTLTQYNMNALGLRDAKSLAFDPSGRLFILDSSGTQIITIAPSADSGFDGESAAREGRIKRIDLHKLSPGEFQGIAFNPNNKHLYSFKLDEQKLYEFTENAQIVSSYDLSSLSLVNPKTLLFAPSGDRTDDPAKQNLFFLDGYLATASTTSNFKLASPLRTDSAGGQIIELSLEAPMALPPGTTLLPTTLIQTIDTSNAAWNPSSPDPAGIAYWPLRGSLLISDSEVNEMPPYFTGDNVFESSLTGTLLTTCSTTDIDNKGWSDEPTGVAINPNNNHIFFSDDSSGGKLHEVNPGPDGVYCTSDDTVTTVDAPGGGDAEGVAYGANTLFIAGGTDREVYKFDLGPNGVLGGGDDGAVTSFDTDPLGFQDLEGIEYNPDQGTLFIVSTSSNDRYIGEVSLSGTLLHAYNLDYLGSEPRSGLAYGPSSQDPATKSIYLVGRGVDNGRDPLENDGKIWEINLGNNQAPTTSSITTVSCTSPVTYGSSSSCTVTVARASGSNTPGGSVAWTLSVGDSGTFSGSPCTLFGSGGSATCSVTYTPSAVGDGAHVISATYGGDTNFNGSSGNQNVTVATKALAPGVTVSNKVYDGTTAATILTRTLTGTVGVDVVSLTGGTAVFSTKSVGSSKPVTGNGFSLSGAQAGNYHLSPVTATTTANITPRGLTVSAAGLNKIYDGTTAATVTLTRDAVAGDVVNPAYASASFATPSVGTGKTVSVSGISISGSDAGNYTLLNTTATAMANITPKTVTATADHKSKVAGDPDPSFTFIASGFVGSDTFITVPTCSVLVEHDDPGTYNIICSDGVVGTNYNISYVNSILTVNSLACYSLTLSHTGQGNKPVASPSNSDGCSAGQYLAGATVNLSGAVSASGWQISGWSGTNNNASMASTNRVAMPANAHTASVIYTDIAPTVFTVTRVNTNPTSATSVDFTVIFSEAVTGVDETDFSLTTSGVIAPIITGVSGSGMSYTVAVNTGSGNGAIRLDILDNGSIVDEGDNSLDGGYTLGEEYIVITTATFADVSPSHWARMYIESLYLAGITGGCGTSPLIYCPDDTVTRAQMAVFLEKGIQGTAFAPPIVPITFNDTSSNWAQYWIESLKSDGVTGGCGNGNYCPNDSVTRAQMAVFLLKSKYGSGYTPPAISSSTGFTDVPVTHWAAAWIKQLEAKGITSGCGAGTYCPDSSVTRAQMAVFLLRTFNLP